MFTIKALERSTSVQESRFVCAFKKQFAYVARKFLLSMEEIQNILLQHNAYISGSTVLAALVGCFTSNDIDFYALGGNVVELKNAIVNLYTGKDAVVNVEVFDGYEQIMYVVYSVVVSCTIIINGIKMIRKFTVQIINCQGSLGMQNFDFFNVMNSFGARNIIRNIISTDCVCCYVRYESIITDNSLVFSSTFQVPENQLVVPVEIVSNQLFITSIDSLRFKTLILNSKVYDIVNAFEDFDDLDINIDDLCHVISGLRKSYYQRVLKYTMRGFVDIFFNNYI
jgi:hypothetical protein